MSDVICWQYKIKQDTLEDDLENNPKIPSSNDVLNFRYIDKTDIPHCKAIANFILRYEWLGKMPVWVTHRFVATYKNTLIGVNVLGTPYVDAMLLGEEYRGKERLIARGASISYAPKNMASWLIMNSIHWMVANTDQRIFTAYADPTAGELGTVYQACNFYYLGQSFGGEYVYVHPETGEMFGDSYFNQRSVIKKVSIQAGVAWETDYIKPNKTGSKRVINWSAIDDATKKRMKLAIQDYRESFRKEKSPKKHKYAFILGSNKTKTKHLRKLFERRNQIFEYPKERGK